MLKKTLKRLFPGSDTEPELSGVDLLQDDPCTEKKIFMHIHKCAGTSMYRTLSGFPGFVCCVARPGNFPQRLSREYIPDDVWDSAFKFTFVRNPYDRVVSAYKMFMKTERWPVHFPTFKDFAHFLQWTDVDQHTVFDEVPIDTFTARIDNIIHHCSSYHNPKYRLGEMNFVGRIETMESDMGEISKQFGVENIELPRMNATGADDYRNYYCDTTKAIIGKVYARDIDRFEYRF